MPATARSGAQNGEAPRVEGDEKSESEAASGSGTLQSSGRGLEQHAATIGDHVAIDDEKEGGEEPY